MTHYSPPTAPTAPTTPTASIGEAAALYALTPSTIRWWERQGVLDHPARTGGRRTYRDADLRRLGLAYLCCVVGKMPLPQAATVTSGKTPHHLWQRTITEQIGLLEQQIEQLGAAKTYLRHLLLCEDDDMAQCRFLAGELSAHTPRGRTPDPNLVTAARTARLTAAHRRDEAPPTGDETPTARPPRDETPTHCTTCRAPLQESPRGRPRKFCSPACRQHAYRTRRNGPQQPTK